jgi:hypothetical protein
MVLAILPWLTSGRTTWLGSKLVVFEFSFWSVGQIRDDHIFAGESLAGGRDIDLADPFWEEELSVGLVVTDEVSGDGFLQVDQVYLGLIWRMVSF